MIDGRPIAILAVEGERGILDNSTMISRHAPRALKIGKETERLSARAASCPTSNNKNCGISTSNMMKSGSLFPAAPIRFLTSAL